MWLDSIHAPPPSRGVPRTTSPSALNTNWSMLEPVISKVDCTGAMRLGRTSSGMATWAATNTANVIAMAGHGATDQHADGHADHERETCV
jgi:hypothetical protein